MHRLHIGRPSQYLTAISTISLEQNRNYGLIFRVVESCLLRAQQLLQGSQSVALNRRRHLALGGCRRSGPGTVFERISLCIADICDEPERCSEVPVCLSWVANDEIGGQGEIWSGRPQTIDDATVVVRAMLPIHCCEDLVGT